MSALVTSGRPRKKSMTQSTDTENSEEQVDEGAGAWRHATNLELFLDLAFVFSVTQITGFLAHDLTWIGVGKAVTLAFLVWWQWTAFCWMGTGIDLFSIPRFRLMVLAMIPGVVVMAVTVPHSLGSLGVWFAVSYLAVQLWVLAIQGVDSHSDPELFRSWLWYAPLGSIGPMILLVGSLVDGNARLMLFILAAAVFIGSALLAGSSRNTWSIDPVHFSERHALFMIIVLGEVLVAVGATTATLVESGNFPAKTLLALFVALGVAITLWWSCFAYVPALFEHLLTQAGRASGTVARNVGSFGHFPLVCGVIAYAVVAKHLVAHPSDQFSSADRYLLFGAVFLFVGGQSVIQALVVRRVSTPRVLCVLATALVVLLGGSASALTVVFEVLVILTLTAVAMARHFKLSEIGQQIASS